MRRLVRHTFSAMGTDCSIVVGAAPSEALDASRAVSAALAEIAERERTLSRFDPASDLCRLNSAAGDWMSVSERLFDAVQAAVAARRETGGLFDPTVLPAVIAAGYDRTYTELRPDAPRDPAGWVGNTAVDLDRRGRRVRLARGTALDLGGIGKGLSATAALEAMHEAWHDMPGALVDLGGDIAVAGSAPDGGAWLIAIADPRTPGRHVGMLEMNRGGVATSGRDRRRLGPDGSGHHLIDPRTGRPAVPGPITVTVVASTTAEAEAHATALAISPVDQCAAYLQARPQLAALIVPAAGRAFVSDRMPLADRSVELEVAVF